MIIQLRSSVPSTATFFARTIGLSSTYTPGNTLIVSPGNAKNAAALIVLFVWFSARPVLSSLPVWET